MAKESSIREDPKLPELPVPGEPIVSLEHVNINVGSEWTARQEAFWIGALGGAHDSRAPDIVQRFVATARDLRWVNFGLQQFHLPLGEPENPIQTVRGEMTLEYEDSFLPELKKRLEKLAIDVVSSTDCALTFRDDAGNRFRAVGVPSML